MIMRDTIFCAIPEDADHDAIAQSIKDVVAEVQTYVPGYRLLNEPQFDEPSVNNGGQALVTTFIEVEGAGDYLPPYAGNLDIMTAAATKVGEEIAKESLASASACSEEVRHEHRRDLLRPDVGHPDDRHVPARRQSPQAAPVHRRRGAVPSSRRWTPRGCRSSRSPTVTGWAGRVSTTGSPKPPSRN